MLGVGSTTTEGSSRYWSPDAIDIDGFSRDPFTRPVESFIPNGDRYFGYLDADTCVEGAGLISYAVEK